jgi:hypothetical protein
VYATGAALCLLSCERAKNPQTEQTLPPHVSLYGVTLHAWQGNELVAMGNAAQLTYDRNTGALDASGVRLRFPSSSDTARANRRLTSDLELSAPTLLADLPTRRAQAQGGVTLRSSAGLLARTPTANFNGQGLVARGTDPIQVTGPGYALEARGFAFYLVTEELIFEGAVDSRLGAVGTDP